MVIKANKYRGLHYLTIMVLLNHNEITKHNMKLNTRKDVTLSLRIPTYLHDKMMAVKKESTRSINLQVLEALKKVLK